MYIKENPWLIGLVFFLLAEILIPIIRRIYINFISQKGEFSGKYLAITFNEKTNTFLVDLVILKHYKNTVRGEIDSVVIMNYNNNNLKVVKNLEDNIKFNQYKILNGTVKNRIIIFSYKAKHSRVQSMGFFALRPNDLGSTLAGEWAGTCANEIISRKTYWKLLPIKKVDNETIINKAKELIPYLVSAEGKDKLFIGGYEELYDKSALSLNLDFWESEELFKYE